MKEKKNQQALGNLFLKADGIFISLVSLPSNSKEKKGGGKLRNPNTSFSSDSILLKIVGEISLVFLILGHRLYE